VRLEKLGKLKTPTTSSGIEPAIFGFIAWCLNQLRYRMPLEAKDKFTVNGAIFYFSFFGKKNS
jgi:hypothetical protein